LGRDWDVLGNKFYEEALEDSEGEDEDIANIFNDKSHL
jgi:hypothetical protein